jgi:HEAT repeat protein
MISRSAAAVRRCNFSLPYLEYTLCPAPTLQQKNEEVRMKKLLAVPTVVMLIALISLMPVSTAFAAAPSKAVSSTIDWKKAERNYVEALKSENCGVRQSAANMIANYGLVNASKQLITVLKNDKEESARMTAAFALVMLGDTVGIEAVQDASLYDGSEKVAKFCDGLLDAANKKEGTALSPTAAN